MVNKRFYLKTAFIFFPLFFFWSCDSKVGDPLTADYHMQFVSINTIVEGAVLTGNSEIPVSLRYDPYAEIFPNKVMLSVYPFAENEKESKPLAASLYSYSQEFDTYFKEGVNPATVQTQKEPNFQTDSKAGSSSAANNHFKGKGTSSGFSEVDPLLLSSGKGEEGVKYLINFPLIKQKAGLYRLKIEFFDAGRSLGKRELFFFFADQKIKINSLEILPAVAYPGGELLLLPQLTGISDSQGYLKISFKNKLIFSGAPEKLGKKLILDAPGEAGVYPLLLEVFPEQPSEGMDEFPFSSPYFIKSDIFVNEQQPALAGDLPDGDHYLLLHHFRGELKNAAIGKGKSNALHNGKPALSMCHGFLGYCFDSENYLHYDSFLLPLSGGRLQPFSLHLSTHFSKEKTATLFESFTENFRFELKQDVDRRPFALFYYGERVYRSKVPPLFSSDEWFFRPLTLSVYPHKEGTQLIWYRGGQFLCADRLPVAFSQVGSSSSGKSFLGKSRGETGVIDEMAIYYQNNGGRPSIDENIFESNLEKRVKKALLYAQGFDGTDLAQKKFLHHGKVELEASSLVLPEKSDAIFKFSCENERHLNFSVDLTLKKAKAKVLLQVFDEVLRKEESLIVFDFEKALLSLPDGEFPFFFEEEGVLLFSLVQKEEQWVLSLANSSFDLPLKQLPATLQLKVLSSSESSPLLLNAVVVDSLSRPQELIEWRKPLLLPFKK